MRRRFSAVSILAVVCGAAIALAAMALLFNASAARATAPAAWSTYAKEVRTRCAAASGLRDVTFSGFAQFGDDVGWDAVRLQGRYPQPFMHGKSGTMICLFNRRDRRAHASELGAFP
jgi:hypothetical protein